MSARSIAVALAHGARACGVRTPNRRYYVGLLRYWRRVENE